MKREPSDGGLEWGPAAFLALVTVYAPQLAPFAVGPLTECDHCVETYLRFYPIVPGMLIAFSSGAGPGGAVWYMSAGLATSAVLFVAAWSWTLRRPLSWVIALTIAIGSGLASVAFSHMLRM